MKRLASLALPLVGVLLSGLLPHSALAQLAQPAGSMSGTSFSLGLTLNNGASYVTTATTADAAKILATIKPLASQLGQGDIYFVANAGPVTYMRNTSGSFVPWSFGSVPTLVPWKQTTLTATTSVDLLEGLGGIPVAGTFAIYIGYKGVDGALVYGTTPLSLTITAPATNTVTLQQAQDYYLSGATPSISTVVQSNPGCIACHFSGGLASGAKMVFHFSSSPDHVSYNVNQFRNGVQSLGRTYILNTVLGNNEHRTNPNGGGAQFVNSSAQGYKNLDTFLQMLEKL